jgi:hypothetical protein
MMEAVTGLPRRGRDSWIDLDLNNKLVVIMKLMIANLFKVSLFMESIHIGNRDDIKGKI